MPALTLFGRFSAISLLVAFTAALQAQPIVASPQPLESSIAANAPVDIPFNAPVQAAPPAPTDERQGDLFIQQQRYQAAIETYSKIAQPSAAVWNKMGVASQLLSDPKDAVRCYKRALKLEANEYGALNNLATLEAAQQNFSGADRLYRRALKVQPGSARILKNMGTNLLMQHRYRESSEAYAKALALDPHIFDSPSGPTVEAQVSTKDRGEESYLWARSCARAGLNDCAVAQLRRAFDEGSATSKQVAVEKDFAAVRQTHDYERLVAEQR